MDPKTPENGSFEPCPHWGTCGGCPWITAPGADEATPITGASDADRKIKTLYLVNAQKREKLKAVRSLFAGARIVDSEVFGLRDKVDLLWSEGKLGLYRLADPDTNPRERGVIDLDRCPLLSPALNEWLGVYRRKIPPIRKGSVRLRVSPSGERGVWLDFANEDVKRLFEERAYLRWLNQTAFVEIGQRRKSLHWLEDGTPKLRDPALLPWFETYAADGGGIPLYGPVAGFSQPGFAANRALVGEVAAAIAASGVGEWIELFAGNGNFALALAARGTEVHAFELDELAIAGLERGASGLKAMLSRSDGVATVGIHRLDAYLKTGSLPPLAERGLLVDPPRAGLRQVLDRLETGERPPAIVYVSCFTEVFVGEAERLRALGYSIKSLAGVDQFPFSPHTEWIALFTFDAKAH